jgi:hypothetical protein
VQTVQPPQGRSDSPDQATKASALPQFATATSTSSATSRLSQAVGHHSAAYSAPSGSLQSLVGLIT